MKKLKETPRRIMIVIQIIAVVCALLVNDGSTPAVLAALGIAIVAVVGIEMMLRHFRVCGIVGELMGGVRK